MEVDCVNVKAIDYVFMSFALYARARAQQNEHWTRRFVSFLNHFSVLKLHVMCPPPEPPLDEGALEGGGEEQVA